MTGDETVYQVIGYRDMGGVARVEQTALVLTKDEGLARYLAMQLLTWHQVRTCAGEPEELVGYSAELRRGRSHGPLDSLRWTPERHDDPVCDLAYLDLDTGSIEWQPNTPTYTVITDQHPDHNVVALLPRRQ